MTNLKGHLVDPQLRGSLAWKARRRRWNAMAELFPGLASMHVVDLGGVPSFWRVAPVMPRRVTCVNVSFAGNGVTGDGIELVRADACAPGDLGSFDFAFSNSTIEHLGGRERCVEFAHAVRRIAPRYWVQTPNRYFPVEPHLVFPAAQFLPRRTRIAIARRWGLSNVSRDGDAAESEVDTIDLLSARDVRQCFPEARILRERFAGMTKSIIATYGY